MEEKHQRVLIRNINNFVQSLNPDDILPYLMSKEIVSQNDFERLTSFHTRQEKVMHFIFNLQTKGPTAFQHFLDALQEQPIYDHLVSKVHESITEYEKRINEMTEEWEWLPMSKYQIAALDECSTSLIRDLQFDEACKYFLEVGFLEREDVKFMRKLPKASGQRSALLMDYIKGKGVVAYNLLLAFLMEFLPNLGEEINKVEAKIKNKEEQFRKLISFPLKYERFEEYSDVPNKLNIILIGKSGSGKSATGNTIIGDNVYLEVVGTNAGTKTVKKKTTILHNFEINVLDTPGLFDTSSTLSNEDIILEVMKTAEEFSQGIHLFLFVCRADVRFTNEEMNTFEEIQENFGEDLLKHCLMVVTHANEFVGEMSFLELLEANAKLNSIYQKVFKRATAIENKGSNSLQNASELREQLLRTIIDVVNCNSGHPYSSSIFQFAKEELEKEQARVKLRERIDDLTVSFLVYELPTRNLSVIEDVEHSSRLNDSNVEIITSKLDDVERSLALDVNDLVQTFVEDHLELISNLLKYMTQDHELVSKFQQHEYHENTRTSDYIILHVLKYFQNSPVTTLNDLKAGKTIQNHEIKQILISLPYQGSPSTNDEQSALILQYINMIGRAFVRQNQRLRLLHNIHFKCRNIMKNYFADQTYNDRMREIDNFINKGFIPPELHCRCLRVIPSDLKTKEWDIISEKLLLHTLRDRINSENAIFTGIFESLKNAGKFILWFFFPTLTLLGTHILSALFASFAGYKASYPALCLPYSLLKLLDCNECGGRHRDKRFTPI